MINTPTPITYLSNPLQLLAEDLVLLLRTTFTWPLSAGIPSIFLPLFTTRSGPIDELYPSPANLWEICLHLFLIGAQTAFFFLLAFFAMIGPPLPFSVPLYIGGVVAFIMANKWFTVMLNGNRKIQWSNVPLNHDASHTGERWVFMNGVAVGKHWFLSNLNQLSKTFRRPIQGIHNRTDGIIFDLIECILQRDLHLPTRDIRIAYEEIVRILSDPAVKKVVLILHSQGTIEGGAVLDWLFTTLSPTDIAKLEIYTFANAANHWNSPLLSGSHPSTRRQDKGTRCEGRVIKHIEHYTNTGDYIAKLGILNFRPQTAVKPRQDPVNDNLFVGRLFEREGTGHLLNQHYLDYMFPMDDKMATVLDSNAFMDAHVDLNLFEKNGDVVTMRKADDINHYVADNNNHYPHNNNHHHHSHHHHHADEEVNGNKDRIATKGKPVRVKDLSRLWKYRNGGVPDD